MKRPRIQAPSASDCPRFEISVPADRSCHGPLCQLYVRFATPFKASVGLFLQLSLLVFSHVTQPVRLHIHANPVFIPWFTTFPPLDLQIFLESDCLTRGHDQRTTEELGLSCTCLCGVMGFCRHEAKCGEAYQKDDQVNDDDLLTSSNLPMIGKKRPSIGASGSTAKRVTAVNSSLESSFAASEKVSDTRRESDSQDAEKQLLNAGSKTPPASRLRSQGPEIAVREAIPQLQTNGAGARKRRRPPEGAQTAGKQEREPTVILAWKQWCMFEDDDKDGDMVGALVNKRDKRRIQERHRKVMLQEHKTGNAGDF